jgi:hypothetical protein
LPGKAPLGGDRLSSRTASLDLLDLDLLLLL